MSIKTLLIVEYELIYMDSNREKTQDCLTRASWAGFYTGWHGLEGDRTEPPRTCTPGHLPQGHITPGHLPPGHTPKT